MSAAESGGRCKQASEASEAQAAQRAIRPCEGSEPDEADDAQLSCGYAKGARGATRTLPEQVVRALDPQSEPPVCNPRAPPDQDAPDEDGNSSSCSRSTQTRGVSLEALYAVLEVQQKDAHAKVGTLRQQLATLQDKYDRVVGESSRRWTDLEISTPLARGSSPWAKANYKSSRWRCWHSWCPICKRPLDVKAWSGYPPHQARAAPQQWQGWQEWQDDDEERWPRPIARFYILANNLIVQKKTNSATTRSSGPKSGAASSSSSSTTDTRIR